MKTHVYKLVLGFMFTLLCITTQAQEYSYIPMVKSGVQIWTNDYTTCSENYLFRRFALTDEDTLIENETYKKLYFFTDSVFNPITAQCIGGLRENSQRQVFYKGIQLEGECIGSGLICDFSLSIGDTFYVELTNKIYKIISIDTVNIENINRREYSIALLVPNMDTSFYEIPIRNKWIEGIGSSNGLLFDIWFAGTTCFTGGVNRCYEYNGELQYNDYLYGIEDCYTPLLGLNNIKTNDNDVLIYPNPASKELTIESYDKIKTIEILNPLGQRVYQRKVNVKTKSIDINSLSKGIYIIGVNTDKGYIKKKLIKN